MKKRDQLIVVGVVAVAALAIFYLGLLKPKMKESQSLGRALVAAQAHRAQATALVASAKAAQANYVSNVRTISSLTPAIPPTDSTSDLLRQIDAAARSAHVSFDSITLSGGGGAAPSAPAQAARAAGTGAAAPNAAAPNAAAAGAGSPSAAAAGAASPAAAAKAAAGPQPPSIPPGYSGSAGGVPTVSYALTFKGGYLKLRQFLAALQGFVSVGAHGSISARGRLLTVPNVSVTKGTVTMNVTGYLLAISDQTALPVPQNAPAVPGIEPASTRPTPSAKRATKVAATTGAHS